MLMNKGVSVIITYLVVWVFFINTQMLQAQSKKTLQAIDSLKTLLDGSQDKFQKVDLLNKLAWENRGVDFEIAKEYAVKAETLSKKINYSKGEALAIRNLGKIAEYQSNYDDALNKYQISIKLSEKVNDQKGVAISYRNMGNVNFLIGKNELAIEFYKKSLAIRKRIDDQKGLIKTYYMLIRAYDNLNFPDSVIKYNLELLEVHSSTNNIDGMAETYNEIGAKQYYLKRFFESLESYNKALELYKTIKDSSGIIQTFNNIGLIHSNQNNYNQALEYYNKVLLMEEKIKNAYGVVSAQTNIGNLHSDMGENEKALEAHEVALTINTQLQDSLGMSDSYNNIGEIHFKNNEIERALHFYNLALELKEAIYDSRGMANAYNNIGAIYLSQDKWELAKELQLKALDIQKDLGDPQGRVFSLNALGNISLKENALEDAKKYFIESRDLSKRFDFHSDLRDAYKGLATTYANQAKYKSAYKYQSSFLLLKDSLLENQKSKELSELEGKMVLDRQKEKARRDQEIQEIKLEASEQRALYIIGGAVLILIVLVVIIYLINKQSEFRKKANLELANRNEIIEEKNEKITASINYAKRIQDAILPIEDRKRLLPNSMVIYRPKDIVSGDFFWISKRGNSVFFVVADCTGHGVPGAFMSMIGTTLFNEAVYDKGIVNTNDILSEVRDGIIKSLKQKGETGEQKDGMDASICRLDLDTNVLEFSGAHNPLYLVRDLEGGDIDLNSHEKPIINEDSGNRLFEVRGDMQPIGYYRGPLQPFNAHTVKLKKGDRVFLITDGYPDQFGGKMGKKFKHSRLKTVLLRSHNKSLDDQREELESVLDKWKGDREQLDDVCIMGVNIE